MPIFADLVRIRSRASEAALGYLRVNVTSLGVTPLLHRFGRSLEQVHISLRAQSYQALRDQARAKLTELGRRGPNDDEWKDRRDWFYDHAPWDPKEVFAKADERERPKLLSELEPQLTHGVLLGDPGSGKTEYLKRLALETFEQALSDLKEQKRDLQEIALPVFLRLDDVAEELGRTKAQEKQKENEHRRWLIELRCLDERARGMSSAQRLAAAILRALEERRQMPSAVVSLLWQQWFADPHARRWKLNERPLVCLDAWDEVEGGWEILADGLRHFAQAASVRVFTTCRITGYDPDMRHAAASGPAMPNELCILPFGWQETEAFVQKWFVEDLAKGHRMLVELRRKPSVHGMAANPLLGTLLCQAYSPVEGEELPFPMREWRCMSGS